MILVGAALVVALGRDKPCPYKRTKKRDCNSRARVRSLVGPAGVEPTTHAL